ncbi:MAG TPA: hypothetical protein VMF06_25450 [Candidatus Limnocylindria bacterium]|nr:hypothetical protein [Candidatus Limnocylindria bacterium]
MGFFKRHAFALVILSGLSVRLILLPFPGTEDMEHCRMWGAMTLKPGILYMYTQTDTEVMTFFILLSKHIHAHPQVTNMTALGPFNGFPDHPPGLMLMLDASVRLSKLLDSGSLRRGPLLDACLNLPPVIFSLGITLLIWWFTRAENLPHPMWAVMAFWLNPALILDSPLLGYADSMFAFFGLLALILFYRRKYEWSALAFALGCLSKPEAMFLIPVLAAAAWADGGLKTTFRYGAQVGLFALAALLPYILVHRVLAVLAHVASLLVDPVLSGQGLNVWWLAGPLLNSVFGPGPWDPSGMIPMYTRSDFVRWVGFQPAWVANLALAAFVFFGLKMFMKQMKLGNRLAIFWAGALMVYGYTMLSLFVHENHLDSFFVYAAPLLALNTPIFKRGYLVLSGILGLDLYLFEGFGRNVPAGEQWIRMLPGFDITILIALGNVAFFLILVFARNWWFDLAVHETLPAQST